MDLRRLRTGEWLLAATGILATVCLFLPWYSAQGVDGTGWEVLSSVDVLLCATGLLALVAVGLTAQQSAAAAGIASQSLLLLLSLVVAVVVLVRVLNLPEGAESREVGAWLGLLSALGLVASALIAMRDERSSKPGHLTDSSGIPVDAHPEIETLPAPPRGAGS